MKNVMDGARSAVVGIAIVDADVLNAILQSVMEIVGVLNVIALNV